MTSGIKLMKNRGEKASRLGSFGNLTPFILSPLTKEMGEREDELLPGRLEQMWTQGGLLG